MTTGAALSFGGAALAFSAFGACGALVTSCTFSTNGKGAPPLDAGGAAPHTSFASGSRLRARLFDAGGGAISLLGWYDAKLDAPCAFRVADDGALRCLPTGAFDSSVVFADAQCTQAGAPPAIATCGLPAPRYVSVAAASRDAACDPPPDGVAVSVYALGDPIGDGVHAYGANASGKCVAASTGAQQLFALSLVDASTFVAATYREDTLTADLHARVRVAEDGSRETVRLVDATRSVQCAPIWGFFGRDDDGPCVPVDLAWDPQKYFADASCSTPAAYHDQTCAKPSVGVQEHGSGCTLTLSLFTPGDPLTLGYSPQATGKCKATLEPPEPYRHHYFTIGAPIAMSAFPQVRTTHAGGGRLQASAHAAADGTALLDPGGDRFVDTQLGVSCRAVPFADGVWRCLPEVPEVDPAGPFADAACTQPLVSATAGGCAADPTFAAEQAITSDGCQTTNVVHALGAAVSPATVYTKDTAHGGRCAPAVSAPGARFFPVRDVVDAGTFATVERRTE